jgi:transcriptional regulator PpsR
MKADTTSGTSGKAVPDVLLFLDLHGVIRDATLSAALPPQNLDAWIGRPWLDTVVDPGVAKVQRIVDDARTAGVSAFRQVNQRFPSGLELPIEYTAFRDGRKGLVAVGKSLQAIAELQSRLVAAQQAMERDYWKLREVETRCRLLFDRSHEAVLLVRAANLQILEANPAALRALDLGGRGTDTANGRDFRADLNPDERAALDSMLHRVRDQGRAPGILVGLGRMQRTWLVRASLLPSHDGLCFLLQLTATEASSPHDEGARVPTQALLDRSPDGWVVLDDAGAIVSANRAFLDMIQVGDESSVRGARLGRWLGRPGADMTVLLANVSRSGSVRLFSTTLQGELGAATEVEVSAAGERPERPQHVCVSIRDVASRLPVPVADSPLGARLAELTARIGRTPLPALVKETVAEVESQFIRAALTLTAGNRTAAAQLLGVSRQSLYAKLDRYGAAEFEPASTRDE